MLLQERSEWLLRTEAAEPAQWHTARLMHHPASSHPNTFPMAADVHAVVHADAHVQTAVLDEGPAIAVRIWV